MTNLLSRRNNNSPNQNNCQRDNSNNSNENIEINMPYKVEQIPYGLSDRIISQIILILQIFPFKRPIQM